MFFLVGASLRGAVDRPNILFLVSEDNGPEIGAYGDPYARTPYLDRLASEGIRFDRAFVPQAGCSQSRAAFLTGLYPHQNGQIGLATWGFRMYREDTPNIPRNLKAAGYRTGIIGKLHVNPESAFPFDFQKIDNANFARKNLRDYARFAEEFMSASDQPFYLAVNFPDAHDPWLRQVEGLPAHPQNPEDVKAPAYFGVDPANLRASVANYYNSMARLDALIGDVLAALQRAGKAENTLVVYIGDHGADFLRGKRSSYEGGLRVPMIACWPRRIAAGQVRDELVSTIDLMPTFLAAAGAPAVAGLPGRSLDALYRPGRPEWRKYLFTEFHTHAGRDNFYPQRTIRNDRYKLIENLLPGEENPGYRYTLAHLKLTQADIDAGPAPVRAAYARMARPPQYELYDLTADPHEFHDLSTDPAHAAAFAELKQQLRHWREQTKDPLLDPQNLAQLKAEFATMSKSPTYPWQYPNYFFGKSPDLAAKAEPKTKGKKKKKAADKK
ncbi:MAG TPA: sulfatase [Opitutaceae bacterium]